MSTLGKPNTFVNYQSDLEGVTVPAAVEHVLKRAGITRIPPGINIAISGKLGSGKTACSDLLVKHHGYTRMSLATPLKKLLQQVRDGDWCEMAQDLAKYPFPGDTEHHVWLADLSISNIVGYIVAHRDDDDDDLWNGKGRHFLQVIGTNWFRSRWPNIWCELFETAYRKVDNDGCGAHTIVCDDMRFPNELEMLKRLGFLTLRCTVDDDVRLARVSPENLPHADHPSETALDAYLDDFDRYIDTGCPMEQQHEKLVEAIALAVERRNARN